MRKRLSLFLCATFAMVASSAYAGPYIASVTPDNGTVSGGITVVIGGAGFDESGTTLVLFNGNPATNVVVYPGGAGYAGDENLLTCTVPAGSVGPVVVEVVNPDLQSYATLPGAFTYTSLFAPSPDIPWESEWTAFAVALSADPNTLDVNGNGLPTLWELTLAEEIITNSDAPAFELEMFRIYEANLAALADENPSFHAEYGHLSALAMCMDGFSDVNIYSENPGLIGGAWPSTTLTPSRYRYIREVTTVGDPDGDGVLNNSEKGTSAATYVAAATTSKKDYRLATDDEVDLLDESFYNNGQRAAWWGQLNNAGTTVAFYGVELPSFDTEIYLVNLGDPSSWRKLTTTFPGIPQSAITWSPDDSRIFFEAYRVNATTGQLDQPTYAGGPLNDAFVTSRPSDNWMVISRIVNTPSAKVFVDYIRVSGSPDGLGGAIAYEFNVDGDAEGWSPAQDIESLVVRNGYLEIEAAGSVPFDPYINGPAESFDAASNPFLVVRMKRSNSSQSEVFFTTDSEPSQSGDKMVGFGADVTPQAGFRTYVVDMSAHPKWVGNITSLRLDPVAIGDGRRNLLAVPIHANGNEDNGRSPVFLTNLAFGETIASVDWPAVSPDFNSVAFVDNHNSINPVYPDIGNIHAVRNIQDIMNAPLIPGTNISSLAPRRLNRGNAAVLRRSNNFSHTPSFSQDESLVMFTDDANNAFRNANFFGSLEFTDMNVGITRARGNTQPFLQEAPLNQAVPTSTLGGTRVLYMRELLNAFDIHLFAATLEVTTLLDGALDINNQLVVVDTEEASDASGTTVVIPPATTVTFPPGVTSPEIVIQTPLSPVETVQLPSITNAVPVVREFGPAGTTFSPPIDITITYTEQEVANLDLNSLTVALFNPTTELWEVLDVNDIVAHDTVNRTITFKVAHFSLYGLFGSIDPLADSDGDGIPDVWEIEHGLNPNNPTDAALDPDDDGLTNLEEFQNDTDPNNEDTDGDGLPDGWEVIHGLDPLDDGSILIINGPLGDPDGDGFTNLQEFEADTDPNDNQSFPAGPTPIPTVPPGAPLGGGLLILGALALLGSAAIRRRKA